MAAMRKMHATKKRFAVAILAGVLAAVLMFMYAASLEAQANAAQSAALEEYGGSRTEVLVATRDLFAGEELSADNTALKPWLSDLLPQGAITDPKEAYGKTLSLPLWKNEPLLAVKLGDEASFVQVPDGLSAVSIPIDDAMAIGGSLLPGSSVDVYAIGATQVSLVLADVLVLEASNGPAREHTPKTEDSGVVLGSSSRTALKWVTLAVQDDMVAELLSAARDNTLSLVLPGQNAGAIFEQGVETPENTQAQEGEDF